jgi:hypothetical protein
MRSFVQDEVTRGRWEAAQSHCEHILALAHHLEQAKQLFALIPERLDTLQAEPSREG